MTHKKQKHIVNKTKSSITVVYTNCVQYISSHQIALFKKWTEI